MKAKTTILNTCYACGEMIIKIIKGTHATFYNTYKTKINHKYECRNNFKDKYQRDWMERRVKPVKVKSEHLFGVRSKDISYDTYMKNPEGYALFDLDKLINYYPSEQINDLRNIQRKIIDNANMNAKRKALLTEIRKYNFSLPEEILIDKDDNFIEGAIQSIAINSYERNWKARKACIEHYGVNCTICNFDFNKFYGEIGENFIHVHHLIKISVIGQAYKVDPINDLRPVCPNCHAMLHRRKEPYTIEELKMILISNKTDIKTNINRYTENK